MSIAFVADENFRAAITQALGRLTTDFELLTAQDAGLAGAPDPVVLDYAAQQRRVLITHDHRTIPSFVTDRLREGLPMPGVVVVRWRAPIAAAASDLEIIVECSGEGELEGQVLYRPW